MDQHYYELTYLMKNMINLLLKGINLNYKKKKKHSKYSQLVNSIVFKEFYSVYDGEDSIR